MNIMQIMQLMNNPMMKTIINSNNPKQAAINAIKNSPNANTEIGKNIIGMLERGDMKEIENYGKNLAQSQGLDVNQLINMFSHSKM